ncbi:hypothetical protein [Desulfovibrio inopinatus]|uniref:hypothetical protein n=1 Tax=Desulfovibrio inopinatus TaxID=102109 RepID=UPI00040B4787|nr:hypothetical protein [Desulfovibrio inopinatus]
MKKRLIRKLDRIKDGKYSPKDFIIADAKDGDMAMGAAAPGPDCKRPGQFLTKAAYLDKMRAIVASGLVDIMLMSASSAEVLMKDDVLEKSDVTPAVRFNDTTDIWFARGNRYCDKPSRPFSGLNLEACPKGVKLGLYSITYSNDLDADYASLEAYKAFRHHATKRDVCHFLEVFNPNPALDVGLSAEELPAFINDSILRTLAPVTSKEAPLFLKIAYNGPAAMEELASYDPNNIVVGILGGSKGTTRDTFELLFKAEKYGARVALFGRKINLSEHPIALVQLMRAVVEKSVTPEEAVRAYHGELEKSGYTPALPLDQDIIISDPILQKD